MNIWWVRHLPIKRDARYVGQTDVPAIVPDKPAIHHFPKDALWLSSPLKRALQTVEWAGIRDFQIVPELMEQHFGEWEGRRYDEVWKEVELDYDWTKPEEVRPPGGESFIDVCARVANWLEGFTAEQHDVVVVAHSGSIRAGIAHSLGGTPADAIKWTIKEGAFHRLRKRDVRKKQQ